MYGRRRGVSCTRVARAPFTPPEDELLFRAPCRACQRAPGYLELVCPSTTRLATCREGQSRCVRPTFASHFFDNEHPRLGSYRHLSGACAPSLAHELALTATKPVDLAFHDARSASGDIDRLAPEFSSERFAQSHRLTPPSPRIDRETLTRCMLGTDA